jgi:hypothetical protein
MNNQVFLALLIINLPATMLLSTRHEPQGGVRENIQDEPQRTKRSQNEAKRSQTKPKQSQTKPSELKNTRERA